MKKFQLKTPPELQQIDEIASKWIEICLIQVKASKEKHEQEKQYAKQD